MGKDPGFTPDLGAFQRDTIAQALAQSRSMNLARVLANRVLASDKLLI